MERVRFLERHGITRKKKTGHAAEQERDDVAKAREAWFEGQLDLDPSKLVFLDETAVSTNMAPRFGWAPRGERCRMSVPFGWKTKTLVAALRWDRIDAPMTIGRCARRRVVPGLCRAGLGADAFRGRNGVDGQCAHAQGRRRQGSHRGEGRARRYLPSLFARLQSDREAVLKIKAILERIAARTAEALDAASERPLQSFTPQES